MSQNTPYAVFKKNEENKRRLHEKHAKGICIRCGIRPCNVGEGSTTWHCAECSVLERERHRNRYRLKKGIDPDAPLSPRGRPRAKPTPK